MNLHDTLDSILNQVWGGIVARDQHDAIVLEAIRDTPNVNQRIDTALFINRVIFWEIVFKDAGALVEVLLQRGADVEYATLSFAADSSPAMVRLLVRYGADIDARSPRFGDPLACVNATDERNDLFIAHGASVDFGEWGRLRRENSRIVLAFPLLAENLARLVVEMTQ